MAEFRNVSAQEISMIANKLFSLALEGEEFSPKWRTAFGQGVAWALQYANGEVQLEKNPTSDSEKMKVCRSCRKESPANLDFFYKSQTTNDKLGSYCKACVKDKATKRATQAAKQGGAA